MPTYNLFKFKIKPLVTNELYAKISGGSATVMVHDADAGRALDRAKDYITKAKWEIKQVEIFPTITEEIQSPYPELMQMQKLAKTNGIGCAYYIGVGGGTIFN
jgi:hypothetical protein